MMLPMRGDNAVLTRVALLFLAVGVCACSHAAEETASVPRDYRQRHPIMIRESHRGIDIFVGTGRGGLTEGQRADVIGLARDWMREATGTILIEVPAGTPNARPARDSYREVRSILLGSGIPASGIAVRNYAPVDPRQFATLRLSYPKIAADAGPCGLWPDDLGPSAENRDYLDNRPYFNFGCANQRNLAAMIDNPSDLVQPRSETPAYTARRDIAFTKYRKGETTTTQYPEADKAKLSDSGK